MAWVSPKVYAILKNSEEGKDILEGIADKDQAEVDKEVDAFFGKGGKGHKSNAEYSKAKADDEAEEERYNSMGDVEYDEDYERSWGPRDDDDEEEENEGTSQRDADTQNHNKKIGEINRLYEQDKISKDEYLKRIHEEEDAFNELQKDWGDEEPSKPKKLDDIIKERSTFTKDKDYDAYSFKKELEENGHKVEYIENRSGTWQDHNGEKYKEYDIKLEGGQHIYFKLIADENYDTKEVICYKNGKNW